MKIMKGAAMILMMVLSSYLYAQKTISEGTLLYNISTTQSENKASQPDPLSGATNTIYLKGSLSKTEMVSPLGKEITIYDAKSGTGVILKEYSGQKLMITLTKDNWLTQNKKFEGIVFVPTSERKKIAGYDCNKATAKLKDGSEMIVYYAPEVNVNDKNYSQLFKNLPGLAVEYEFESGKLKFKYTLASIDPGAVPVSKFDIPKSGYRVMTYDESRIGVKSTN
jgi:GLPGLI family protein